MESSIAKSKHVHKNRAFKAKSRKDFQNEKYKKFRGNVEQGQGFADMRKKKMFYQYKKLQRKEQHDQEKWKKKVADMYREEESVPQGKDTYRFSGKNKRGGKKMSVFDKPQAEFRKKKEDKKQKSLEHQRQQKEREAALDVYQKKKKTRQKLLAKKTEKGQPHIGSQMKYLLEKIEKQVGSS